MGKAAEQKTVLNLAEGNKITRVEVINEGRTIEIYSVLDAILNSTAPEADFERKFPIVEASKLSLDDEFLKYEPETYQQEWLKETLMVGIKTGLKDFRRPAMDPSFKDDKIVYEAGLMPAVGKSCNWWHENAKKFMPERNSRLGTEIQYAAFLGVLIKYLINEMGYTVSEAWEAVGEDSKELGHYWNSKKAKQSFEATGSRLIGLFYDLTNTAKLLSNDDGSVFWIAGGGFNLTSNNFPLADMNTLDIMLNRNLSYCVGWLVLDA